jgi:5'-3' exonuclease
MGIQGLTPFLKKFAPSAFTITCLSDFTKKKIAIDISLFLYKYKVIHGDQWLSGVLQMLTLLRSFSIHPIVIFDGEAPVEKIEEQQNRRAAREERVQKCNTLMSELEEFNSTGTIATNLQEFYNKQAAKFGVNSQFDVDLVTSQLDRLKNQSVRIYYTDIELVQSLLSVMRIPYFQAPSEAEGMCSWLCKKNLVDGVLTEDTDVLAYGATKFLSKLNMLNSTCVQIDYTEVLQALGMTKDQFTEFCIMCGCDYNQRIKGLGPVRAYKLFLKHGDIDTIIKENPKIDFQPLKHVRVKDMFTVPCSETIEQLVKFKDIKCGRPNYEELTSMFKNNSMIHHSQYVYNSCLQDVDSDDEFKLVKSTYKRRKSPSMH